MPEVNLNKLAFQLTLHGGNAKDLGHDALTAVKEGKYEQANNLLADAESELEKGREMQAEVMRGQDREDPIEPNMMLTHALDHLMSAESELKLIKELIDLHKKLEN